jgi:membrane protein required for colicin V production
MIIDVVFVILMVIAIFKGISKGFIVAVFSIVAFIIGLAAAIKLSAVVAEYIGGQVNVSEKWLPVISFTIVFIGVIILVRLGAKLLEKTVQMAMLGWLNRLGGILFFALLYILIYSVMLFYTGQLQLIKQETMNASVCYRYISPVGPKVMNGLGEVVPVFKNMFAELEDFFGDISGKIPAK